MQDRHKKCGRSGKWKHRIFFRPKCYHVCTSASSRQRRSWIPYLILPVAFTRTLGIRTYPQFGAYTGALQVRNRSLSLIPGLSSLSHTNGWMSYVPFNSLSVITRRWKHEHERLCAMKRRLGSGRISPPAGFKPATP